MKSWIEISAVALTANVAAIRQAAAGADVLAVIKADAYGHGADSVARVLANAGVRWFGVTDVAEGIRVRAALGGRDDIRLLVMVGMETAEAPAIVQTGLTPVIWTPEHAAALDCAALGAGGGSVPVHIEIDTGMGRQGARPGAELDRLLTALANAPHVQVEGLMTHLSESECAGSKLTEAQLQRFAAAAEQVHRTGIRPRWVHAANTSAVDEAGTTTRIAQLAAALHARTLVRTGYALYGHCLPVESSAATLAPFLQPALSWKSRILDVRHIQPGDTVGYGATFTAVAPMRLALLPVGYADGFRRAASSGLGNGWVVIRGQQAPVVGRVSMNLTVIDVTAIAEAVIGDESTLLGHGVTAEDHARWAGTIGYDILCGIRADQRVV